MSRRRQRRLSSLAVLILSLAFLSCVTAGPVSMEAFDNPPTVAIAWPILRVEMPHPMDASCLWIEPDLRVDGAVLTLSGRYMLDERPWRTTYDLRKYKLTNRDLPNIRAVWLNPDESTEELPIMIVTPDTQETW